MCDAPASPADTFGANSLRARRRAVVDWLSDSPNASTAVAIDVDDELGRRLSRVSELV
jgi:hypothetical protein